MKNPITTVRIKLWRTALFLLPLSVVAGGIANASTSTDPDIIKCSVWEQYESGYSQEFEGRFMEPKNLWSLSGFYVPLKIKNSQVYLQFIKRGLVGVSLAENSEPILKLDYGSLADKVIAGNAKYDDSAETAYAKIPSGEMVRVKCSLVSERDLLIHSANNIEILKAVKK